MFHSVPKIWNISFQEQNVQKTLTFRIKQKKKRVQYRNTSCQWSTSFWTQREKRNLSKWTKCWKNSKEMLLLLRYQIIKKLPFTSVLNYSSQEALSRIYPNLFRLLWHTMLPCFPKRNNPNEAHMLHQCKWQGKLVNCSDIFTPVVTDSGICCAFNVKNTLVESNYSRLVSEMQGQKKMLDLQNALPGMERGLQVIVDQHSDRWKTIWFTNNNVLIKGSAMPLFSPSPLDSASS